jgi:hypothetical protein
MKYNLKLAWADFFKFWVRPFCCTTFYLQPLLGDKIFVNISTVFYRVKCALFYMENDAEIFPAHYKWRVAENRFKMASMMNKLAVINSCEIILEKLKYFFFAKANCEIQVGTILVWALYSIKIM